MKAALRIASAVLLGAAMGSHAGADASLAEEAQEGKSVITSSISQSTNGALKSPLSENASFDEAVAALVHETLGEPEEDLENETVDREALIQLALRAFYAGSEAAPIWVNANGANRKARDAAGEIGRAGDYGLDPEAYELPAPPGAGAARKELAGYELAMTRAVLAYAHHAKAGRVHPEQVGHDLNDPDSLPDPRGFLEGLLSGDDAAAQLRDLHPKNPRFVALKQKLAELRGAGDGAPRVQIPDGPVLREGVKHEQVALLRKRLEVDGADADNADMFDDAVKEAVEAFQKEKGLKADGIVGNSTRHALNGESNEKLIVRILANMERWRWLPDNMGGGAGIYVWTNIPEFRVRVVRGEEVLFSERAIVGKTYKQTPVFSDQMEWIEFHPTWYVPNSIKVEDIKPSLRRQTSRVMERYHLRLDCGRHGRDWKKIDWSKVDIRNCSISQPPGERSVLGDFKFKFPNKHDVYMHDTPQKGLFKSATRTYSHGCVRVQNPRRMAEVLLDHDKRMPSSRIGEILAGPKQLHQEDFNKPVPVHMTYFTAMIDDDGVFQTKPDIYGHDRRLAQALTGKGHLLPVPHIASPRRPGQGTTRTAQDRQWRNAFTAN